MSGAPKLSTTLAISARQTMQKESVYHSTLLLFRHVQKSIPELLKLYGIDADPKKVRGNIKAEFRKFGKEPLENGVSNMLVNKGQMELDEAKAQWKTRTHILKYVYDIVSEPHLARSKLQKTPLSARYKNLAPEDLEFLNS
ncbi:hypothetical protein GUITHDRAFT_150588 [Guillardia theta CCMP2712]|uniref:Uncharacterized protein n=2 Tax=Guillardia theta TaxID=55529 RepID=L1JWK3_GUITC|nr:hypothetical protein GUITHDRAFT_150588 [Guillardia theta CCMP2712]EKX52585.1 hypothetical protein GUITHDRAFT_150588 [Guillardia theta CCMP2712]|eukprot:XP_005839565.1 hypothetical protein GUITHDRAFT_150588 [Guillardia theta CCMP2712]